MIHQQLLVLQNIEKRRCKLESKFLWGEIRKQKKRCIYVEAMRLAVLWTNAAVSEKQSYKYLWNQNDEKKTAFNSTWCLQLEL